MELVRRFASFSKGKSTKPVANVPKLRGKFRLEIYDQLATFITDGFKPFEIAQLLAIENGDKPKDPRAKFFRYLARQLTQGKSMAAVLEGLAPQTDLFVIEASEETSNLDEGFRRLIYFSEKSAELKSKIMSLLMPIGLSAFALGVLYGFATGVVPDFATMVRPGDLGLATISLLAMGTFLEEYIGLILLSLVVYFAASFAMLEHLSNPFRDKVLNRFLPPWSIHRLFVSNSFLLTLGTLMKSGIRLKDALPMVKKFSNRFMRVHIEKMEVLLSAGSSDGRAIATDLFSTENRRLLRIYGWSEQFDEKMEVVARRSLEHSLKTIGKVVSISNTVMTLTIAAIIIWIVFAMGGVILPLIQSNL